MGNTYVNSIEPKNEPQEIVRQSRHYSDHPLRLPMKIILVRHGESLGNVDGTAFERIPGNFK